MNRTSKAVATCSTANTLQATNRKNNHLLGYFFLALLLVSIAAQPVHALHTTKRNAYVVNNIAGTISEFAINPVNGALGAIAGCPALPPLVAPTAGEVNPSGQFLYVADATGGGAIWAYPISPLTGCLLPPFPPTFLIGVPFSIGVDNEYVYVSEPVPGFIEGFTILPGGALGAAVPASPFVAGPSPMGLAIDSAAPYLYVANDVGAGSITAFTRLCGGGLAVIAAFPTGAGTFPFQVAVDPVGQFVFVTNVGTGTLVSYPIVAAGALGPANPAVLTGAGPLGLAVSKFGQVAYVANNGPSSVSSYIVSNVTGAPVVNGAVKFVAPGVGPIGATIEQQGKFLYVADDGNGLVSGFSINDNTGILLPIVGTPWPAGPGAFAIATQP